jgi:GT2 family glycosyltransferase
LQSLLERTKEPFDLIVVDGGSPPEVRDYLRQAAEEHRFLLIRNEEFITPNQARNLVLDHVQTRHVVFVDNDVLVQRGWLTHLVHCAETTGAWVVGPLYCEFEPEAKRIHMFGGEVEIRNSSEGVPEYHEQHHLAHLPLNELTAPLTAKQTQLIEFHTVLVQMKAFEKTGRFDEGFFSHAEHGDFCLQVTKSGGDIWVEPRSVITYAPPKRLLGEDRKYFLLRWSEAWCGASYARMSEKYGVPLKSRGVKRGHRWLARHRRFSLPWLFRVKRSLGAKLGSRFEKSIAAPLETLWNKHRHPKSIHSKLPILDVSEAHPLEQHSQVFPDPSPQVIGKAA